MIEAASVEAGKTAWVGNMFLIYINFTLVTDFLKETVKIVLLASRISITGPLIVSH